MSTRARHRREARAAARPQQFVPDADYATVPAWCATEDDLPDTRQATHDTLIALMGDKRTGGVKWLWWTGAEAERALGIMRQGAVGEHADNYRRCAGHLREYGGYLVVAMAQGSP